MVTPTPERIFEIAREINEKLMDNKKLVEYMEAYADIILEKNSLYQRSENSSIEEKIKSAKEFLEQLDRFKKKIPSNIMSRLYHCQNLNDSEEFAKDEIKSLEGISLQ